MPPPSPEQSHLTVAADGKASKQFHQADGKAMQVALQPSIYLKILGY
jgi:3-deoxy-D-manno-octulosonate 8-phosphate phosphatase KdsC-like HAD superfamily phosphatase